MPLLRAHNSQQLADTLTSKSGTSVKIYYDRQIHRYRVVWTNGPDVAQMYTPAMRYAPKESKLDPSILHWDRNTNPI